MSAATSGDSSARRCTGALRNRQRAARCAFASTRGELVRGGLHRQRRCHGGHRFPGARRRGERALRAWTSGDRSRCARQLRHLVGRHSTVSRGGVSHRRAAGPRCRAVRQHAAGECLLVVLDRPTRWSVVLQHHRCRQPNTTPRLDRGLVVRTHSERRRCSATGVRPARPDTRRAAESVEALRLRNIIGFHTNGDDGSTDSANTHADQCHRPARQSRDTHRRTTTGG